MPQKLADILKGLNDKGVLEGAAGVLGNATALATSDSKYKGGQRGSTIGGALGTAAGSFFGMGAIGSQVGSMIGGLIGGASDTENMIEDFNRVQKKKYSRLDLADNINPYGTDNTYYMAEGGVPGPEDPGKPGTFKTRRLKPDELTQWNKLVDYTAKKNYIKDPRINAKDGSFSKGIFAEYAKVDPSFKLTYDDVASVQNEFLMQRDQMRSFMKRKNMKDADTFGSNYSPVDAFAGDKTLSQRFVPLVEETYHNDQLKSSVNRGLMNGSGVPQKAAPAATKKALPAGAKLEKLADGMYYEDPASGDLVKYMKNGGIVPGDMLDEIANAVTFKDGGIHIKPENRGKFTAAAKRAGMGVQEYARHVLAHKERYSPTLRKRANFARNFGGRKEYGGMPNPTEVSETGEKVMVNIEKGEILIDPITLEVVREYNNPNRYKPHSKKIADEVIGNFTMIDGGHVVIPKKYAERFKKGDALTRKSITAEILKNQENNPDQNEPRSGVPQARTGYTPIGDDPITPFLRKTAVPDFNYKTPPNYSPIPDINFPQVPFLPGQEPLLNLTSFSEPPVPGTSQTAGVASANPGAVATGAAIGGNMGLPGSPADPASAATGGPKRNLKLMAARAASFLPTAFGIGNALGIDPFLQYDENTQFDAAKSYVQGMETSPNIEASKAAIRRQAAGRNRMLNNFNSPATRAEVAANNADVIAAEGNLIQNATNTAMEMRNRKRESLARLEEAQGSGRLNMRQQLMNELRADKANRENMIHQGISEGVTNYQMQTMDDERIRAVNSMAQFYQLDPANADLLMDNGAFMGKVIESLGRLKGKVGTAGSPGFNPSTKVESVTRDRIGNTKQSKTTVISKKGN